MKALRLVAMILMIVGSLNWGLVGFFQFNLVGAFFGGEYTAAARVIFGLVGLAGLYGIGCLCRCCGCGCKCGPKCNCCKKK